jgi:hypothetical protein
VPHRQRVIEPSIVSREQRREHQYRRRDRLGFPSTPRINACPWRLVANLKSPPSAAAAPAATWAPVMPPPECVLGVPPAGPGAGPEGAVGAPRPGDPIREASISRALSRSTA